MTHKAEIKIRKALTSNICRYCDGQLKNIDHRDILFHKLGCPYAWEMIFRNVGDWWNAQKGKDMCDEATLLEPIISFIKEK